MSGGLASPAARRSPMPELVVRSRPESATRMPVRQPPAALGGRRSQVPSTRERMQASFVAGPRTASREAIRPAGPVEAAPVARATVAAPAAEALTTRERIVNRALAAPEAASPTDASASSVAVDLAEMRDHRRPQRSDAVLTPAHPTALAPVIPLAPRPQVAMPGARGIAGHGDVVASSAPARAGPEAVPKASATTEPEASAEVGAAPESWTLDTVDPIFTGAENAARKGFEEYVDQKMRACKAGCGEVRTFVIGLPVPGRELGKETAGDLGNQFEQLSYDHSSDTDAQRDDLGYPVARQYVESWDELDTRIAELQEVNKGFVAKAIGAVPGAKTTYELGELLRVLLKAACAIGDIVVRPIRFLGNLVDPAEVGVDHLVSRTDVHLQEALLDLLFGQLGSVSSTLPTQRIQELRPDDSPGASAPGIGDVRRHGQQTSRVHSGPRVWWTEPEHVMPFAVGEMLWDTVSDLIPGHGGVEDGQQTTIMIYALAARQKASGHDGPVIGSFTSQYIANLQPEVRRLRRFREAEGRVGVDSPARRDFTGVFGRALARMAQISSSAVAATQAAVRDEHADADASGQTNGARRAEPAPLPTNAQIAAAAEEQYDDVVDLARAAVERSERR